MKSWYILLGHDQLIDAFVPKSTIRPNNKWRQQNKKKYESGENYNFTLRFY